MKPNYAIIDVIKFIMTLLMVSIHIKILPSYPDLSHFFTNGIGRIAVPFFFICSGFLFINKSNYTDLESLIKIQKRLIILFVSWTIIYFTYLLFTKFSDLTLYEKLLKLRLLFISPYGHLWYLPALMIGIAGTWFFHKLNLKKLGFILSIILYLFGILGDAYYFLATENPILEAIFDKYHSFFSTTRNGIFFGFPLVYLASLKSYFKPNTNLILAILFFLLLVAEYFFLKENKYSKDYNILFFIFPFSKFFFDWIISLKINISSNMSVFFRKYSLGVYLIHVLWIDIQPIWGGYAWVVLMSILSVYIVKKLNLSLLNKLIE